MRRLRIVGDGERDAATVPPLVRGILKADFTAEPSPWPRLHRGEKKAPGYHLKGYGLKLYYLLRSARSSGADGVVATVDADKATRRQRLNEMRKAREADRAVRPPLPAALGEARPHSEAWLLDDPAAVREGLGLSRDAQVPNVRDCSYPKHILEELHRGSPRHDDAPLAVWPDIAAQVEPERCAHKEETGFEAFAQDVQEELGPLFGRGV